MNSNEARKMAMERLVENAVTLRADAVIGTRYDSSPLEQVGATDIFAYGTAVNIAPSKTGRGKEKQPVVKLN